MYRVLIVDDETYVVDWLSALLESRKEPELDVCRAYSAAEALAWLNRAKIDIVITDIRMPDMSGIALTKKVRKNWPQCKVILLTAHAEFDYAYEAIENEVTGYILKTEEDARILSEVDKAVAQLDREMKNLELLGQVQDQIKSSLSVIRRDIVFRILNEEDVQLPELFRQLGLIGAELSMDRPFLLLTGRIGSSLPESDIIEKYRRFSSVQKTVEQYFNRYFCCDCVEYSPNRIAWLLQAREEAASEWQERADPGGYEVIFAAGMLETVQRTCRDTYGLRVSFVLQGERLEAGRIPENFHSLDRVLQRHAAEEEGFVIVNRTEIAIEEEAVQALSPEEAGILTNTGKLKTCLDNNRREEYLTQLEKITDRLGAYISRHSNAALELYFSVALVLLAFINQRKLTEKIAFRISLNRLFQPQSAGSWEEAGEYLRNLSCILFDLQAEDEGQHSNNIVRFLRDYINGNIAGDVSLVRLSEVSGYNASYLSRFFRESTGETLNDYISRQKLQKIAELMGEERLNIGEVAVKAGFESRTYFNRFVKRVTGMSPQEYREQLARG